MVVTVAVTQVVKDTDRSSGTRWADALQVAAAEQSDLRRSTDAARAIRSTEEHPFPSWARAVTATPLVNGLATLPVSGTR